MAISFHAEVVHFSKEDWGWKVVWSLDKDLTAERYLALQRADKSNLLDTIFGRAKVCCGRKVYIECCGQGWSWYGRILSFELYRDRVRVKMDSKAAREMQDDGKIDVTFDLSPERFGELQTALSQVFLGHDYYKVAA